MRSSAPLNQGAPDTTNERAASRPRRHRTTAVVLQLEAIRQLSGEVVGGVRFNRPHRQVLPSSQLPRWSALAQQFALQRERSLVAQDRGE